MSRPPSQIRYGNRAIQLKQQNLSLQKHYQTLRRTRPMTGNTFQRETITINNKKKEMLQQNRFTQIQRENRMLFHKISSIMGKGSITHNSVPREGSNSKTMKTLNGVYRKRHMQNIQFENAKMLKRLKQKKSSYQATSFNRDWQKKKRVIQKMSLYPFILNDNIGASINRERIYDSFIVRKNTNSKIEQTNQIRRIRKINGFMFLITVRFQSNKFFIIGDIREQHNIKIIELERQQGEQFIREQCQGNIENIFDLLRYDIQTRDMYLVGKDVGEINQIKQFQQQRNRAISQHGTRISKGQAHSQQFNRTRNNLTHHLPPRLLSKQLSKKNKIHLDSFDANNEQMEPSIMSKKGKQLLVNKQKIRSMKSDESLPRIQNLIQTLDKQTIQKQDNKYTYKQKRQWVKIQRKQNQEQMPIEGQEGWLLVDSEVNKGDQEYVPGENWEQIV